MATAMSGKRRARAERISRFLAASLGAVAAGFALSACGSSDAPRPASPPTRTAAISLLRSKFIGLKIDGGTIAALRVQVRVAASDPHFARAVFEPLDSKGKPLDNAAAVVLIEDGGQWSIIDGPGTGFSEECRQPTVAAIRDLVCPDPFSGFVPVK